MGATLSAPLAKFEKVYALPMLTIKDDKGNSKKDSRSAYTRKFEKESLVEIKKE